VSGQYGGERQGLHSGGSLRAVVCKAAARRRRAGRAATRATPRSHGSRCLTSSRRARSPARPPPKAGDPRPGRARRVTPYRAARPFAQEVGEASRLDELAHAAGLLAALGHADQAIEVRGEGRGVSD
jgi:hypothetical protein